MADSFTPTESMKTEAQRGLDWRSEHGRGGTEVGIARARDIVNGKNLSEDTVHRMVSYFARHEVDKQGQGWSSGEDGYPSAGRIAWALWGGDAGRKWSNAIVDRLDKSLAGAQIGEVEPEADNDAPQSEPKSWRTRTVEAVVSNRCGCDACGGGERWSGAGAMERLLAKAAAPEADPQPSVAGADAGGSAVVGGDAAPVQSKLTFSRKAMVTAWDDATGVQAAVSAIFRSFQAELQSWYAAVVPTMIADHLGANGMPMVNNLTPEQANQLQKMCDKFLSDTVAAGGADGLAKVGVDPDTFTRANEDAIKYIQQRGLELAKSVPDTLKETVNNAITGMMRPDAAGEAQLSIANVRDAVLREVPTLTDYQAERIARTELTNAFNEGNRQGWKQAGVETKQWDVAGGQCDLCSALANRYPNPIHIDEMFTDGEWSGQGPTRHPNCRCGLLPGVEFKE